VLNWGAIAVPIRRFIINLSIYLMLGLTFIYADKSGIHTGVVTSLFCSSLIFTIAYFYFRFKQNLQKSDWIGILFVIVCVILISVSEGKPHDEHGTENDPHGIVHISKETLEEEENGFNWNKLLTIVFALTTGLVFSTNSIEMHYSAKNQNVPATVMNVDGNFILGILVLPFYIFESTMGTIVPPYTTLDIILANANIMCIIIASTGLTAAMGVGQAGPVQAIEMMKTVW
jgi:drug/metabolite transporter (DMT)-like permease